MQSVMSAELSPSEGVRSLQLSPGPARILFRAEDGTRLLGVSPTDLSTHGLPPYEGWESLEERLVHSVDLLGDLLPLGEVTEASIRYINRVEIPAPTFAFSDYLTIGFALPGGWPDQLTGYLDRSESLYPDGRSKIAFTWASVESPEGTCAFVLDLDLSVRVDPGSGIEAIRSDMADLKAKETAAFESLLQPRLRELFGEVV